MYRTWPIEHYFSHSSELKPFYRSKFTVVNILTVKDTEVLTTHSPQGIPQSLTVAVVPALEWLAGRQARALESDAWWFCRHQSVPQA